MRVRRGRGQRGLTCQEKEPSPLNHWVGQVFPARVQPASPGNPGMVPSLRPGSLAWQGLSLGGGAGLPSPHWPALPPCPCSASTLGVRFRTEQMETEPLSPTDRLALSQCSLRGQGEIFFSFLLFFFGHAHSVGTFSGQGWNLHHSADPSHGSDSAGSLNQMHHQGTARGRFA